MKDYDYQLKYMRAFELAVWAMLRNWSGLYERGERLTREAQLARSLADQLTDDLQSVTYRTPPRGRGR